ncbi:MAG: cbb3-type cytochrome c oxidase subunit I [Chloroflexota bacterium]
MATLQPTLGNEARKNKPIMTHPAVRLLEHERWQVGAHLVVAFIALLVGILMGPFQTFRRSPWMQNTYGNITEAITGNAELITTPIFTYYYQALTLHGVLNALVFTTFFIMGISYFVVQRSLQRPMRSTLAVWLSFWLMVVGMVLAGYAIVTGQATVLFTFYPPMLAHWSFYLGLTLVVVGSWVGVFNSLATYFAWRKDNPGKKVPLATYAIIANFIMWFTATLGVAVEILTMLLPMSLGIIDTVDPQVARVFFWFFGHPLVYFWLIPAYVSWYTMLPEQLGVKLFSDTMGRIAFLAIAVVSIPIGVHHLFQDPGVSEIAKIYHSALTFVVVAPSLLTAFNVAATMERAGRKRGATNLIDWTWKLPWGNPVIAAQFCGMLLFIFGGISGIMNASYNMNTALHNTTWVVGHFHTTLAGAVFLTYISITFWILPMITRRKLYRPGFALAHVYTWFFGMLLFAGTMGRGGMAGATRRTDMGAPGAYVSEAMGFWMNGAAISGVILLISSVLLYIVLVGTFFSEKQDESEMKAPVATEAPEDEYAPPIMEKWRLWVTVIIISNIIMWGPVLIQALDFTYGFWVTGRPDIAR